MSAAQFEFGEEVESATGWTWPTTVFVGGQIHRRTVSLTFQDYDLWSRGRVRPVQVAEACLAWLLERDDEPSPPEATTGAVTGVMPDGVTGAMLDALPERFDCGRARRTHPRIDAELPARLGVRFGG